MVTTAPESSFNGNQQCLVVSYGLLVLVGTASFTRMTDIAIVTAWLIYRQVPGTDALEFLDFKHVVSLSCHKHYVS